MYLFPFISEKTNIGFSTQRLAESSRFHFFTGIVSSQTLVTGEDEMDLKIGAEGNVD